MLEARTSWRLVSLRPSSACWPAPLPMVWLQLRCRRTWRAAARAADTADAGGVGGQYDDVLRGENGELIANVGVSPFPVVNDRCNIDPQTLR